MSHKDSLYKQIEDLGKALSGLSKKLSAHKGSKQLNDQIDFISQSLLKELNIELAEINTIPLEHFISTLTVDSKLDNKNLDLLADLFFETAKALNKLGNKENSKRLFQRSLYIYQHLLKVEYDIEYERHLRINELKEILLQ